MFNSFEEKQSVISKQFINGEWVDGSSEEIMINVNPFNHETICRYKAATIKDVDKAYQAAKENQRAWEDTTPNQKIEIIEKAVEILKGKKDYFIDLLIKEVGSTRVKAEIEWGAAIQTLRVAASYPLRMDGKILASNFPGKENRVYRSAKGVVGVIAPFNFPFILTIRSVVPALATGNTVVVKAASEAPITSGFMVAELFEEAGLPKGVLNVVSGRASDIGDEFVQHPIPNLISFTGSTKVGRHVAELAGRMLKDTALELGGNNVMIILEDADIDLAAESAAFGAFLHQGQICMSLNRIIVLEDIYLPFISSFKEKVQKIKSGDPSNPETFVGPLINTKEINRIQEEINASVRMGAEKILEGPVKGNVMSPVVLTNVQNNMPIAKNEIFGPVAPIIKAKDEQEAIAIANDSPYGLSGSVFSGSLQRGVSVAKQIETGMIHVNDQPVNEEAHVMFGGVKDSGLGRFGGEWALDKFTNTKWISVRENGNKYPFFQ